MSELDFSAALKAQVEKQQETGDPEVVTGTPAVPEPAEPETPDEQQEPDEQPEPDETEEAEPDEGEPAAEVEPVEPEYTPEVAAYVERHGSVEKALQVALEAQSLIGRQGSELGELRSAVEQLQQAQQQQRPQQQYLGDIEERIADNPQQMAAWALQNEQETVFEAAMAEWYDQDPRSAARFERTIEQEILKAEITSGLAPAIEPARQQALTNSMVQAKRELVEQFPDAEGILESATQDELVGLDPTMVGQLRDQNPRAALEVVYRWVKSGRQAVETQTAQQTRAETAQVKKDAAVVKSASSTPAREEKTAMDLFKERMLAPAEYSVSHGLRE